MDECQWLNVVSAPFLRIANNHGRQDSPQLIRRLNTLLRGKRLQKFSKHFDIWHGHLYGSTRQEIEGGLRYSLQEFRWKGAGICPQIPGDGCCWEHRTFDFALASVVRNIPPWGMRGRIRFFREGMPKAVLFVEDDEKVSDRSLNMDVFVCCPDLV